MEDFLRGFLRMEAAPVELPSGEGFGAGFVGPVMAAMLWKFWSTDKLDLADWMEQKEGRKGFTSRGRGGSWFYFFEEKDEAKAAADELGAYAPSRTWRFEVPTSEVINFGKGMSDPEATWGATLGGDCRVTTLASKYRHEFHLIALPAAVNALALRVGYIKESLFPLDTLIDNQSFTDEFQARMIGGPNVSYQESELWKQRAALWAALGEENPAAYNVIGTGTTYDTVSEKLSAMLGIAVKPWVKPVWGRLVMVPDPRVDATYGAESKRLSIPAITTIYADEAAARAAVVAEQGEGATSPASKPKADAGTGLAVPADWAGYESAWKEELGNKKKALNGALPPGPKLAALAKELSASTDEIRAWWELV